MSLARNYWRPLIAATLVVTCSQLSGCLGAAAVGATTVVTTAIDPRTTGTIVEDQAIEIKAASVLAENKDLTENANVQVTSYNMAVLLTGEAPDEATKDAIGVAIGEIAKVTRVHNELVIAPPDTLVSRGNDAVLTTRVKTALLADQEIVGNSFKVISDKGVVYLLGLVTREQGQMAAERASRISGVNRVVLLLEYQ